MGKFVLAVFCTRPAGFLVAIFGVCICSLMLSVYYVHSVKTPTPLDIMRFGEMPLLHSHIIADDNEGFPMVRNVNSASVTQGERDMPEDDSVDVKSLNNIDISLLIQEKERDKKLKAIRAKLENRPKSAQQNVPVTPKKEYSEKWPIHDKVNGVKLKQTYIRHPNPLYERSVRTRKNWHGERYIVYICHNNMTCAGWGDRQHGIFSAYLLSLVTNRTFKVDFTNPCPLNKLFHPRINNWKIDPSEFDGLTSTHVYAVNDRDFRVLMKEIDFDKYYPQDVVYLTTNYDYYFSLKGNPVYKEKFRKKIRGRPRPVLFADLWQLIFKMNQRVVRRFTPALNSVNVTGQHKLVCAHIRFGRNPTIPNDSDVRNTPKTIKPLWEFLKQHSDPKKYRLFVASDWEGFRKKVNEMYKEIALDIEGDIIHIDKAQGSKYGDASSVNVESYCNALEKVVADQHILSKCDILLLTYSVFGKAAAYLRRSNKDLYLMDGGKIHSLTLFGDSTKH